MRPDWRELYEPGPVPRWLEAFEESPRVAVDALLWQRFHHGPLQPAEPQDLVADWARDLGAALVKPLDAELSAWVEANWGVFPDGVSAARLADAWSIVADVVTWVEGLAATALALRTKFESASEYLGLLSTSPSRDPLGRFYGAVAAHQDDPSLVPFWWRLAELPEGIPDHHARYALEGLRGMPAPEGELDTGYRPESVQVLGRLARGLARRAADDPGSASRLERHFLALGRLHLESLPLPDRWQRDLGRELASRKGDTDWLLKLVPDLKPSPVERPPESWRDRRPQILQNLKKRHPSALPAAENLLDEQRRYAQTTGEADEFLVRTLCNFAKAVWPWRPEQAVEWTCEALDWAPWNGTVWTTLLKSLLFARRPAAAVEVGWQARERFPENPFVHSNLGEALKTAGRLEAAEAVYRETVDLFPSDVVARNGLAGVLVERGDWNGAEATYQLVLVSNPDEKNATIARTGLRTIERRRAAVPEPTPSGRPQPKAEAPEVTPQAGEARTWRRQARCRQGDEASRLRRRVAELLDAILEKHPHDPRALVERLLLALDQGDVDGARELLDGPASRLAAAPTLLAALARLERQVARSVGRPLDDDALDDVLEGPHRLRNLDESAYGPLVHLQEGRALLALGDGSRRLEIAARHLDRLRAWTAAQPQGAGDFAGWWAERVADKALDGKALQAKIEAGDVEVLDAWQRQHDPELDVLEEDFCLRQAALRSEPRLPASS